MRHRTKSRGTARTVSAFVVVSALTVAACSSADQSVGPGATSGDRAVATATPELPAAVTEPTAVPSLTPTAVPSLTPTAVPSPTPTSSPTPPPTVPAPTTPPRDSATDPGVLWADEVVGQRLLPPDELTVTTTIAPATGDFLVHYAQCDFPICAAIGHHIGEAAALLGWRYQTERFETLAAGAGSAAIDAGLTAGADVVLTAGRPATEVADAGARADAAGVPVISAYSIDGAAFDACIGCDPFRSLVGDVLAAAVISDSGGDASIVHVTVGDFPTLAAQDGAFLEALAANCPACRTRTVDVTFDDIEGRTIPDVVMPVVEEMAAGGPVHLVVSFGDLLLDLRGSIALSGFADAVTIVGQDPLRPGLEAMIDGASERWISNPIGYAAWSMIDCSLRLLADRPCPDGPVLPVEVLSSDSPTLPTWLRDGRWNDLVVGDGIADIEQRFSELWGLDV